MKVTPVQLILIQIAMSGAAPGVFYPHERQWNPYTDKFVNIRGSGMASAIRSLKSSGKAFDIPELHNPYAFKLTPETQRAFRNGEITA